MTSDLKLILTYHAKERMAAKGISEEQVRDAIRKGAKQRQTDGFLATYTYIDVAYKIVKDKYVIKTVKIK